MKSEKFAIGGEGVEVGVVFGEGASGFGCAFGAAGGAVVEALALAGVVTGEQSQKFVFVVGKIAINVHVCGEGDEGDQVGGLHFCGEEFLSGVHRAINLLGFHGGKIPWRKNRRRGR